MYSTRSNVSSKRQKSPENKNKDDIKPIARRTIAEKQCIFKTQSTKKMMSSTIVSTGHTQVMNTNQQKPKKVEDSINKPSVNKPKTLKRPPLLETRNLSRSKVHTTMNKKKSELKSKDFNANNCEKNVFKMTVKHSYHLECNIENSFAPKTLSEKNDLLGDHFKSNCISIPKINYNTIGSSIKECPICLDYLVNNLANTVCGHVYHYSCIIGAVQKAKCCPVCMKELTIENVHQLYL